MTLHVSLPKELENLVHSEVKTGLYSSASELVREALRRYFIKSDEPAWVAPEMRRRVEALLRGEYEGKMIDGDALLADLEQQYP
jgi:antitoxin ParD1/3/4